MLRLFLICMLLIVASPFALRAAVALWYRPHTHLVSTVEPTDAAIILGAQVLPTGRPSAMLADRIATGADLYHAGKVQRLIMSGDGRAPEYNEPEAMRAYAIALGVPTEAIIMDYEGTRTYATCYRARHTFAINEAVIVTQNFHLDRALLLCNGLGVRAVGVAADYQRPTGYLPAALEWSQRREFAALPLAVWDLIQRQPPEL